MRLGEKVVSIGTRAFAGCGKLRFVYIPDACKSIASDAFEGDEFLVIVCAEGSAACRFAIDHGIAYLCD